MAIILSPKPPDAEDAGDTESKRFFNACGRVASVYEEIGDIDHLVSPHCRVVEQYMGEKIEDLYGEKAIWAPSKPDLRANRESLIKSAACAMVRSEYFGDPRINSFTRICFNIKLFLRKNNLSRLPREFEGIGEIFCLHIGKYAEIMESLLPISHEQIFCLMEKVRLTKGKGRFIDRFIGQFVHDIFWAAVRNGDYPREYFRIC